jgi:hypothetical protein
MKKAVADKLLRAFEDVVWMAIRYANGRHTYAPQMVRDAIASVQTLYPDWKLRHDRTIKTDVERMKAFDDVLGLSISSDYLDDLFEDTDKG